jgi:hypothetical protein
MINTSNISIYLSKLSSGELTEEEFDLLLNFLEKTESQKETYSDKEFVLDENFKESLRKVDPAFPVNFSIVGEISEELFFVAAIENQLTEGERIYFDNKLASDQEFEMKYQILKKTILPVDSFIFPEKKKLKQKSSFNILKPIFWSSVAASLLFFVWFTNKTEDPIVTNLAKNTDQTYRTNKEKHANSDSLVKNKNTQIKKALFYYSTRFSAKSDTNSEFPRKINDVITDDNASKKDTNIEESLQIDRDIQNEVAENKVIENDMRPSTKPIDLSEKKKIESLTLGQYINRRWNKWLYRKQNPDKQDKYYALTTVLKRTLNIDVKLKKTPGKEERLMLASLSIGKFKYEHK